MNDSERKFLEENFKAGEYTAMSILVRNEELAAFVEYISKANLTLAVMPHVKAVADFLADEGDGNVQ